MLWKGAGNRRAIGQLHIVSASRPSAFQKSELTFPTIALKHSLLSTINFGVKRASPNATSASTLDLVISKSVVALKDPITAFNHSSGLQSSLIFDSFPIAASAEMTSIREVYISDCWEVVTDSAEEHLNLSAHMLTLLNSEESAAVRKRREGMEGE
jgi:hypothetical protein